MRILIQQGSKSDLAQVAGALRAQGCGANLLYGGEEKSCENGENAEYDD